MTKQEERAYWLAWSEVPGIGSVLLQRLHQQFGTLAEAWKASASELGAVEGFGVRLIERVVKMRGQYLPEQLLEQHLVKNPCFWTPADGEYPRLLLEIPSPPPRLYYSGVVDLAENYGSKPIVGIVGTRNPSEYGKRWTRKISATLAKHGFTVVSGMAVGIDTQAHRGCLEAGGRTIAVLGTGLDVVYPLSNSYLYKQIQEQGLVISEYPASTKPARSNFPQRNRIIAGLSRAVLVMEAPNKSGALITARLANEFCRDVYALPGSLDNPNSIGCLGLLNRGAHVILSEGHLLEMLGAIPELDPHSALEQPLPALPVPTLEPALAKVLDAIAFEPTSFDIIVQQAALEAGSVSSALLQLELMGLVSQAPGMRYRRLITE
ncbi:MULTISPECIES: DNA-processing protein DprA [Moorena]|uniref:DNA protecting protein DprA n=1 Tax=Moorena producens 3L TaxID=489825 RepID=F4Y094_9CYAN|nr:MULTISPECIES: DNA-processing protein DprA [Moorena]EGJ29684.1 DNA protecting protein DprA [Moorena producens 3L]NEP68185.1 DNA-protecting protein DprA [Moorena sp. SIO3A5]OLT65219.1 DNA protecting protein DprA [Moorena producens 3L]